MKNGVILIQVAMEVECANFLKMMGEVKRREISGYFYFEGEILGRQVVLSLANVGLIESSCSLTLGISVYHPSFIINYGIAGATSSSLHVGDMVVGEKCLNINSYRTAFRGIGEGMDVMDWELMTFLSGKEDRLVYYEASPYLLSLVDECRPHVHYLSGVVGSGDVWNQELDRISFLHDKYHVLCEDMESIATYTIANHFSIPVISFKMISDNSLLGEEYDRGVGIYLQEYVYQYVCYLIEKSDI